jgi:hypothetical protein
MLHAHIFATTLSLYFRIEGRIGPARSRRLLALAREGKRLAYLYDSFQLMYHNSFFFY